MSVRRLGFHEPLDSLRDELIYTRVRLELDPDTRDLAPVLHDMVSRLHAVRQVEHERWNDELVAQAHVDAIDFRLDRLVGEFSTRMDTIVVHDRNHPRWRRYFNTDTPGAVRRLGLVNEIRRLNGWMEALHNESEPELRELGKRFSEIITDVNKVLEDRQRVIGARTEHHTREIMPLVDDLNALRLYMYRELTVRLHKTGNDRRWPEEFFFRAPWHHTPREPELRRD